MKTYDIYIKPKKEKGITLIALTLTIVVMMIIIGVSVNTGTQSLNKTRLQGFYAQLEIIQKRIDNIATTNESYVNSNGQTVYLKQQGTSYSSLTDTKKTKLQNILANEASGLNLSASTFKYFTKEQLESILGLSDMDYDVFVDFDSRTVIAEDGVRIDETTYHLLNNKIYYVELDSSKNSKWAINSLEFRISIYGKTYYPSGSSSFSDSDTNTITNSISYNGTNNYKITVTPINKAGETINGGSLKYKKTVSNYWENADGLNFIISDLTQYDILYEDNNQNKIQAKIKVWLNSNGVPMITVL